MDISNVLKIAKSMKRPYIFVNNNYIIGTDEDFFTLSLIEIESQIPRPFAAEVNDILNQVKRDKSVNERPEYIYIYNKIADDVYINTWNEPEIRNKLLVLLQRTGEYIYKYPVSFSCTDMEKDVNFMTTVAKLKVENGLTSYILGNKYLMTSFNKVHAINASDKISINIYEIDSISYICEFIIDKKKYKVKEYIRYRYMK